MQAKRIVAKCGRASMKLLDSVGQAFDRGIDDGEVTLDDLFDRNHRPIEGTDPTQYLTRGTEFYERVVREAQNWSLDAHEEIYISVCVNDHGYAPAHMEKYSQPQRPDDRDWNLANARNRMIFDDRVGMAAAKSTDPFLLQIYRRDMGNGKFALMKSLSAPIFCKGRHWGCVRLGYDA